MQSREGEDLAAWASILDRARAGSSGAFEQIYTAMSPAVAGYLRMSAVRDVEGLTNETFLHVHRGLSSFDGDWRAFRSWVFTIAHHRMVDDVRRAARQPTFVPMDSAGDACPRGDAERDALDALSDVRLHSLLAELTEDQRSVLLLRIVADLPLEQVAATLGKRVGAVKALQHRALARLRRALDAEMVER